GSAGAVDDTLDSGDSQVGTGTNVYDSLPGNAVGSYHNSNGDVYISVSNGGSNYLSRFSEDGTFDSSFGTAGKVTTANFGGRITLDNSGNLLIANANQVQRYLNKETFDTSFGSAGTATTCVSCYIHSVIVDSNDNIKLVGNKLIASFFNYAFMVDQLTPNGLPDPSFNGGSPLISNRTSNTESFNGVLTNSSNDFLMAGQYNYIGGNSNIFVARYKNDSSLDTTFSGGELNIDPLGNSGGDVGMGIAYDNNGKIVVVGTQTDFVTLMRFNTNGTFDTSFGGTGKVSLKVSPNGNFFVDGANYGFGIDSLNRIIVTGRQGSYPDHLTLVRFLEDGNPDSTFGSGGIVDIVPTSGITSLGVPRVFISQDDSILHFSNINTGSGARIAVTRFWP
ncbi:MAG: hypothetical protein KDD35_08240, partial [Bdellovibrionales bacterium]|nr:hypothetical protein [Bdellovibrionales bacterium]